MDPAIVDKLLRSNVLKRGDEKGEVWELRKFFNLTDESVQLRKLCRAKGRVKYNASPTGYGRVYAQKGLSLALLRKQVRGTLCNGVYVDWDMVNAHPTILLQLLRRNCADRPELWRSLEQYCEHRDGILSKIMEKHGASRGAAKQLLISLLNGGTYAGWKFRQQHAECCGGKKKDACNKTCNKRYDKKHETLGDGAMFPSFLRSKRRSGRS